MKKILSSKASMDSAMKLREELEKALGLPPKSILVSTDSGACRGHQVLLRYGCSYGSAESLSGWGDPAFTRLCVDKKAFAEAIGGLALTPKFYNDHLPTEWPVLFRATLTGHQSEGVKLCHNREELLAAYQANTGKNNVAYWTPYIKHSMEIRVLVVYSEDDDPKIRIYKKVPRDSTETSSEFVNGINGDDNTKWLFKETSLYPKVRELVDGLEDTVLNSLGGKFVAFDMIYSNDKREWVVLEANSGPWLSTPAAEWLARIFIDQNHELFED